MNNFLFLAIDTSLQILFSFVKTLLLLTPNTLMKTLLSYILENIDKPVVSNAIALGRITIEQVVKKHSPKWQHELMQTEWYENKQDDISFLFKYVKTNETEAINGLKDQLALS